MVFSVNYWPASITTRCVLCGLRPADKGRNLCSDCASDLPWLTHACPICGEPQVIDTRAPCPQCSRHPPPFDRTIAAFTYHFPVDRLLGNAKYHHQLPALRWLSQCLIERIQQQSGPRPDLLVPIPSHPLTLLRRGFNQAELISGLLASALDIPQQSLLRKRLLTRHQNGLNRRERLRNLRNAFAVKGTVPKHIALVDDVMTTGATATQAAHTLRKAGAERIEIWVIARTPSDHNGHDPKR